ncbi:MAG: hypothetical protein Q4C49_01480 [Bacillota bacterium]|nr:hypothetical protein [Bacillota bacterium]
MSNTQNLVMFIEHCDLQVTNETEHSISKELIKEITNNEDLIIEKVSERSLVSQASISRFIRKAKFPSWATFRSHCTATAEHMRMRRMARHNKLFKKESKEEIADVLYNRIFENVYATKKNLDYEKIDVLLSMMLEADQVMILGDEHALSIFYTLQLDLVFHGIPTYLYRLENVQKLQTNFLTEKSVLLYLSIEDLFTRNNHIQILETAKKKHCKIACLAQQELSIHSLFDYFYLYGIENSTNDGYYSLFFLSQLLSELLVEKQRNVSSFRY